MSSASTVIIALEDHLSNGKQKRAMALPTLIQNHSVRDCGALDNVHVPSPQPTGVSVSFASISSETCWHLDQHKKDYVHVNSQTLATI